MNRIQNFRNKVLACWMGKNIGGTLGGPFEGFPCKNHLTFYDPVPTGSLPNDDLELQAMYAAALDRMEQPEINRGILADIWLRHMNFHCDEYAVAMRNLSLGIRPPWSGSYDNCYVNGMGAAIRSELWACLAPGDPDLAVRFAREDACIDHAGDGVEAELFFAALESLAFVETDLRLLIDRALSYLSEGSTLAAGIRDACTLWEESGCWEQVRDTLFERYANECKTDVRINVPFTVLALLSGGGEFGKTICDAANCGMDSVSPRTFSGKPQAATASISRGFGIPSAPRPLTRVLRRWAKLALTTRKKKASSVTSAGVMNSDQGTSHSSHASSMSSDVASSSSDINSVFTLKGRQRLSRVSE